MGGGGTYVDIHYLNDVRLATSEFAFSFPPVYCADIFEHVTGIMRTILPKVHISHYTLLPIQQGMFYRREPLLPGKDLF